MRKRFEQQLSIGQKRIEDIEVNLKCRDAFPKLVLGLKKLYMTPEYNEKVFEILEAKILKDKKETGRPGMDLWQIFVLGQVRLALDISYDRLYHMANFDTLLRQLLGIENESMFVERKELEYQNIIDNISLLDDQTLSQLNNIIVEMGHSVFKKKEEAPLHLKTDSFVVESNVHTPTDYNLLWDSARKTIDCIEKLVEKYPQTKGWRKLYYWYKQLKNGCRAIGMSNKKNTNKKQVIEEYLEMAGLFSEKLKKEVVNLPMEDEKDLQLQIDLEYYMQMLAKHIDLLERRGIQDEKIPHSEKVFSIFETYTEMIIKGKQHPQFELGKNVQITTDQYNLIIDHKVMENEVDKSLVIPLADKVLQKYHVNSWSFDKGFFTKENKELLQLFINNLIMPKKGKLNKAEYQQEHSKTFKKFRNKHSAIESNINELEYKGLDRCPDKGYAHFKNYIAMGICAYNLHRIGAELRRQQQETLGLRKAA